MKHHRIDIRDQKRQLLDQYFEEYESEIEQYEFLYQEELMNFELHLPENDKKSKDLMECLMEYLNTQTMNKICQIRYDETLFRHKLLHPRHRSASSKIKSPISIYPEAIIGIFEKVFTQKELDFLSSFGTSSLSFVS